tara:strand:+ start:947 stop:1873 length:927 start_codon:yes stop_codon:yes gene_type:complete
LKRLLRLAFLGSPQFSVPSLKKLLEESHEIVCVYTQPPRPAGRKLQIRKQPVYSYAESKGLNIRTPENFSGVDDQKAFMDLDLDIAVVVAYGSILPEKILTAPRLGCINLHASYLPRWRGAAPIQHAIMSGDKETGISIIILDKGVDTGPILNRIRIPILKNMTFNKLHDLLSIKGAEILSSSINLYSQGKLDPFLQENEGVIYAPKISSKDRLLNFNRPAEELERQVRALNPIPSSNCLIKNELVKVFEVQIIEKSGPPGTLLNDEFVVACKKNALRILKLQRPGKKIIQADEALKGWKINIGDKLN